MSGSTGPLMTAHDLNAFVYALHYKLEAIEKWAPTVSESITDHAEHIDETRSRANRSFKLASDEINNLRASAATGEPDTRQVMKLVEDNDNALKTSIAIVGELLGTSISSTVRPRGKRACNTDNSTGTARPAICDGLLEWDCRSHMA